MKISKDSWHYKLLKKDRLYRDAGPIPTSLCAYFWRVFWNVFRRIMLFFIPLLFFGWVSYTHVLEHGAARSLISLGVAIGVVATLALGMYVVIFAIPNGIKRISNIVSTKDNLFLSYVRAVKDKTCPLIEFVDKDKDKKD